MELRASTGPHCELCADGSYTGRLGCGETVLGYLKQTQKGDALQWKGMVGKDFEQ